MFGTCTKCAGWILRLDAKTHHLRLGLDDEQKELMRVLDEDRIRSGATD